MLRLLLQIVNAVMTVLFIWAIVTVLKQLKRKIDSQQTDIEYIRGIVTDIDTRQALSDQSHKVCLERVEELRSESARSESARSESKYSTPKNMVHRSSSGDSETKSECDRVCVGDRCMIPPTSSPVRTVFEKDGDIMFMNTQAEFGGEIVSIETTEIVDVSDAADAADAADAEADIDMELTDGVAYTEVDDTEVDDTVAYMEVAYTEVEYNPCDGDIEYSIADVTTATLSSTSGDMIRTTKVAGLPGTKFTIDKLKILFENNTLNTISVKDLAKICEAHIPELYQRLQTSKIPKRTLLGEMIEQFPNLVENPI